VHCESIPARSALYDWHIELHRHESFFQILHLGGGSGELRLASGSRAIGPGTLLTLPPRVVHGFRFSETVQGSVITVRSERIATLLATAPSIRAFFAVPRVIDLAEEGAQARRMAERIDEIAEECAASREGQSALLEANLAILLVEMARLMAGADAGDRALGNRHARQFQGLVDRHFRDERTVAFYADKLGISETHLNRIARGAFDLSALGVITQKLIREAARDLIFTRFAVKEIAYSLGFDDPAYFTRFFTKHMGSSPARFRAAQTRAAGEGQSKGS
jgi:AraC family transcriptional regulator, transcriptional activator of pobA